MLTIHFNKADCQNVRRSLRQEWLETNGLGGYSSSTIPFCNTRKYHGLLVANLSAPEGRHVLLSTMEETLAGRRREFGISCRQHPGTYYPKGWEFLESMEATPWPTFTFRIGDYKFVREIMMPYKQQVTLLRYTLIGPEIEVLPRLMLKPLLAYRHFHALTKANLSLNVKTFPALNGLVVQPYNTLPPLFMQLDNEHVYYPSPDWFYNAEYMVEEERGFPYQEDLFMPACIETRIAPGQSIIVSASTEAQTEPLAEIWEEEAQRRRNRQVKAKKIAAKSPLLEHLMEAGEAFLIEMPDNSPALLAGYHWFDAWGRDSLIALPGLTFCAGRVEEGKRLLETIGASAKGGLIPNCYRLNAQDNAYNSVDASLWYAWTTQQLLQWTRGNSAFVGDVCWPVIQGIVQAYMSNTVPHVFMDASGMLHVGDASTQLTWMDASVDGKPVTSRHGCPVEINALWYNTLMFGAVLARKYGKNKEIAEQYEAVAAKLQAVFMERFWVARRDGSGYLADVWREHGRDVSVRPNQIFAISMPYSLVPDEVQCKVVYTVQSALLTPFGLRTLSPESFDFCGTYEGSPSARDAAYHQGTVWPWPLGAYGDALLATTWDMPAAIKDLLATLQPLCSLHLQQAGIGSVSEIFDALPPYYPDGCIAQAWSVAELLRLLRLVQKTSPELFAQWENSLQVR